MLKRAPFPCRPVRRLIVPALLLALVASGGSPVDAAHDPEEGPLILVPSTNGTFVAGLLGQSAHGHDLDPSEDRILAGTHHSWALEATDCHRRLYFDLAYRPGSLLDDPDAVADAPYVFDIAVTFNGTTWTHRVSESPQERRSLGTLEGDGNLPLDLTLRQGLNVK